MTLIFNKGSINGSGGGGSGDSYTKAETNALLSVKASTSLDNLNADGQMIIDSQNGTISNCILEIPQNIKMEISADKKTITLKSGSTCVKSGSTYTTITTIADVSVTNQSTTPRRGVFFLMDAGNWARIIEIERIVSGSTDSKVGTTWHVWFDTDNKDIKFYATDPSSYGLACYPCCVFDIDSNGDISFAKDSNGNDMIFNGIGFIGDAIFTYPNIKGLIPNGFNEDGSLRSTEFITSALTIITSLGSYNSHRWLATNGGSWSVTPTLNYIKGANRNSTGSGYWNNISAIEFDLDVNASPKITNFTIRQPYEGARNLLTDDIEEEVATKQTDVTTLTGYDSTQTQTLKNINGVLTWVTD